MKRHGLSVGAWVDVAVLTVLSLIGILGFASSFQDSSYLIAGLGGLLVGTASALLAASLRLGILVTALTVLVAYFLFGSALAMSGQALFGFLPTPETLAGLVIGAVFGWADIVTLTTPVAAPDYIAVLPYVAAWIAGVLSATIAARWFVARRRTPVRSLVALLAPIAIYVTGVVTGTEEPYLAALRGISFAAISLVWLSWRVPVGDALSASASRGVIKQKLLGVGAVVVAAVLVGATAGAALAPPPENRFVLRDNVEPPFDPLDYPSPLAGFRNYTNDLVDTTLFTVEGLGEDTYIRLATMDSYDGQLWRVASAQQNAEGSGAFRLIANRPPVPSLLTPGEQNSLIITIEEYSDFWLPVVGYPERIDFDQSAPVPSTALRYNESTGISLLTSGVSSGLRYELTTVSQRSVEDSELSDKAVAQVDLPIPSNVPDTLLAKANELAGDAVTPIDRLRSIEEQLSSLGYLSHGSASNDAPSSAGHGADRLGALFATDQWVGDEEQFAAAFALMARHLGYPSRVVMGFHVEEAGPGAVEVTGSDVTAWVEVAFHDVGWIPFYPLPQDIEVPKDQAPKPQSDPEQLTRQPPRADAPQDDLVSAVELEDAEDEEAPFEIPQWVWAVAGGIAIPLALYFIPVLLIALLKRRRRDRRLAEIESDRCAAGAWDELVDTYVELGYSAPRKSTRLQLALGFEDQFREELVARERERASAAERKAVQAERAEEKKSRTASEGSPRASMSSIIDATVVRARETVAWRPGVEDDRVPLPAIPGLREFAVQADRAVFSGADISDERLADLWRDSDTAIEAARGSVSWFRRQLSKFRIRPRTDIAGDLITRINSTIPDSMRGAMSR